MKTALALLPFLALPLASPGAQTPRVDTRPDSTLLAQPPDRAAESVAIAAARAADDARIAATIAADRDRLDELYSDELSYAHSNGLVDTKASLIRSLASRQTVYESFEYKERRFTVAGPGVVLMRGRVVVHASAGGRKGEFDLNFLAVWQEEGGAWRFLAWQSCRNPAATAKQ